MQGTEEKHSTWLNRPILSNFPLTWEVFIFSTILILAFITRFYDLESRVMSHDESLHTYFSWKLFQGQGYEHSAMMHGPLQFHLISLVYFIFGDNDFTSRIPAVLASIATIGFLWNFRRYLGSAGTLVASALFLISPYMLYYGRYVRNEAFVVLFGVITIWAVLRYLDTGTPRYLLFLTAATVLHFASKETSFIYTAQVLLFLGFLFLYRVSRRVWNKDSERSAFLFSLVISSVCIGLAIGSTVLSARGGILTAEDVAAPLVPGEETIGGITGSAPPLLIILASTAVFFLAASLFFLLHGYGIKKLRSERTFGLIVLLGSLVLPQLAPFLIRMVGWDPLDYSSTTGLLRIAAFVIPMFAISLAIGLLWNPRQWIINSALFYAIFFVLYTTVFTNGAGVFSGLVESLGYWLEQQGVKRGSQPWYYYILIQLPLYEYLAIIGTLLAAGFGLSGWIKRIKRDQYSENHVDSVQSDKQIDQKQAGDSSPSGLRERALIFIGFWTITSLLFFTIAGEKMPWLSVHIALPMLLLSGWSIGQLFERINPNLLLANRGYLVLAILPVFFISMVIILGYLFGTSKPFQGQELDQLRTTSNFLMAMFALVISGWGLRIILKDWERSQSLSFFLLAFFSFLGILTIHTTIQASYIDFDKATEYLVYAHSARGVKDVMKRVEDISFRTTDGLALEVAYDDDISWPFTWYLRNYFNQRFYGASPSRDLRNLPVILVGDNNFSKIEPVVGNAFYRFDYIRMWWPNQDYFNLTVDRIKEFILSPTYREAIFKIWLDKDFDLYGEVKGIDYSLPNWNPSDRMRMYIRKDFLSQLWDYGVGPVAAEVIADPYEGKYVDLTADSIIGQTGARPGEFNAPRGIAVAPDGSIYVADSENHRIQHISQDGTPIATWGSYASLEEGEAPGGTFYQPWGIALGQDGSVYVADTWNHRIQKFSANGEFVKVWGYFDQSDSPYAFWGPRDIVIDINGNLLVTDTGNKRVSVFDSDGNFISRFGSHGFGPGQFDEPVGIAIDPSTGLVYIADTWNQRVQIFESGADSMYSLVTFWEITGWYGQNLDNKPFITIGDDGLLYATDPEGARVLSFTTEGEFLQYWGEYSVGPEGFGIAQGIASDGEGGIWVSDSYNDRLLHFTIQ
jgi:uncharacterized protein (TIGR03663 family)